MTLSALGITDRDVTLVTARALGKGVEILRTKRVALGPEGLSAALQGLREAEHRVILVVPRSKAILKEFELPEGSPEELVQMVRFQVEKELPLPPDQIRYSYVETARVGGKVRVQVAAVPQNVLAPELEALAGAGFRVNSVTVSTFGLVQLIGTEERPVAIVGISGGSAEILISEGGTIGLSRSAAVHEGAALEEFLSTEIHRAFLAYGTRPGGGTVARVVLPSDCAELIEGVRKRLDREVTGSATNGSIQRGVGVVLDLPTAALVGICLGAATGRLAGPDLLHPPKAARRVRHARAIWGGLLAVTVFAVTIFLSQKSISDQESDLKKLRGDLRRTEAELSGAKQKETNTRLAHQWRKEGRFAWHQIFRDLSQTKVPSEDLYVTSATFEESGRVEISGKTGSMEAYEKFREELKKLPYLRTMTPGPLLSGGKAPYENTFTVTAELVP